MLSFMIIWLCFYFRYKKKEKLNNNYKVSLGDLTYEFRSNDAETVSKFAKKDTGKSDDYEEY